MLKYINRKNLGLQNNQNEWISTLMFFESELVTNKFQEVLLSAKYFSNKKTFNSIFVIQQNGSWKYLFRGSFSQFSQWRLVGRGSGGVGVAEGYRLFMGISWCETVLKGDRLKLLSRGVRGDALTCGGYPFCFLLIVVYFFRGALVKDSNYYLTMAKPAW